MTRIAHIWKELVRSLSHNLGTAISSILSLTLLFLLFDLFWIAAGTSDVFYSDLLSDLRMDLFVDESVDDSAIYDIEFKLAQIDGMRSISFVSRDSAREELSRMVGVDLLAGYEASNPLPRSFVLFIMPKYLNSGDMNRIAVDIENISGIASVNYNQRWLEKAESARAVTVKTGMILGLLILLTALVSSANNIRFMTRVRAVGFFQMRLQGAGRLFIAMPFIIEGFLLSGISAAAGWFLLEYGRDKVEFTAVAIVFPSFEGIMIFCLATAIMGAISGLLGVRKVSR